MTQFHEDTSEMTGAQLVGYFNRLAAAAALLGVPAKPVNRFADSHKARQRIAALQLAVNDAARAQPEVNLESVAAKLAEEATIVPETLRQDTLAKQEAAMKAVRKQPEEESEMAATKKAAKPKKTKTEGGAQRGFADDAVITVKAKENPRRGAAAERFALYKDGMTVAQYAKKFEGGRSEALVHLRWDVKKGFITVK